ncbi:hypothetical protein [Lewinella sp. IMCC34191]|uniref:hypothetical protein n=1 Tax=Lewinella sp. IMCC34191 TaxID=2259172 RepID=UPI000E289318|nr:hypothetical protein [Lewinella sp. IMCC34191]
MINPAERRLIIENAFAYLAAFGMLVYGAGKWIQFEGASAKEVLVSEMTGMQLMWAFYGYSPAFALVLGALEITGGVLLLIPRLRLFGCLLVSVVLVNIILQDIFYEVHSGALRAALVYQFSVLLILILRREQVVNAIRALWQGPELKFSKRALLIGTLSFILFVGLRIAEYFLTRA